MMQVKGSDGRRFSYGRDIIQLFPRIGHIACHHLVLHGFHPSIRAWAEQAGCTQADLGKAAVALAEYVNLARTVGMDKPTAWQRSGLAGLHPVALQMVFFFVGVTTADLFLQASLEAMPVGAAPWGADKLGELTGQLAFAAAAGSERKKEERLADAQRAADKLQSENPFDS